MKVLASQFPEIYDYDRAEDVAALQKSSGIRMKHATTVLHPTAILRSVLKWRALIVDACENDDTGILCVLVDNLPALLCWFSIQEWFD